LVWFGLLSSAAPELTEIQMAGLRFLIGPPASDAKCTIVTPPASGEERSTKFLG